MTGEGAAPPVTIRLEGSSMQPLIRRNVDTVTIIPLSRDLKTGDVILFTTGPGHYVVHRVWKIEKDRFRTLGDNCFNPDPWLPRGNALGQAIAFCRNGRKYRLDTRGARLWGRFWMLLYPARKCFKRFRSFAGRCYRKVFK